MDNPDLQEIRRKRLMRMFGHPSEESDKQVVPYSTCSAADFAKLLPGSPHADENVPSMVVDNGKVKPSLKEWHSDQEEDDEKDNVPGQDDQIVPKVVAPVEASHDFYGSSHFSKPGAMPRFGVAFLHSHANAVMQSPTHQFDQTRNSSFRNGDASSVPNLPRPTSWDLHTHGTHDGRAFTLSRSASDTKGIDGNDNERTANHAATLDPPHQAKPSIGSWGSLSSSFMWDNDALYSTPNFHGPRSWASAKQKPNNNGTNDGMDFTLSRSAYDRKGIDGNDNERTANHAASLDPPRQAKPSIGSWGSLPSSFMWNNDALYSTPNFHGPRSWATAKQKPNNNGTNDGMDFTLSRSAYDRKGIDGNDNERTANHSATLDPPRQAKPSIEHLAFTSSDEDHDESHNREKMSKHNAPVHAAREGLRQAVPTSASRGSSTVFLGNYDIRSTSTLPPPRSLRKRRLLTHGSSDGMPFTLSTSHDSGEELENVESAAIQKRNHSSKSALPVVVLSDSDPQSDDEAPGPMNWKSRRTTSTARPHSSTAAETVGLQSGHSRRRSSAATTVPATNYRARRPSTAVASAAGGTDNQRSDDRRRDSPRQSHRAERSGTEDPYKGLCSVCFENVPDSVLPQCYHAFCHHCLEVVKNTNKKCPKCQKPFRIWRKLFI